MAARLRAFLPGRERAGALAFCRRLRLGSEVGLWTMSQRTGSVSYLIFSAGVSLAIYALFVVLSDVAGLRVGLFRTFGTNALAAYLLHPMVGDFVNAYAPKDSPFWYVLLATLIYFLICYGFTRYPGTQANLPAALIERKKPFPKRCWGRVGAISGKSSEAGLAAATAGRVTDRCRVVADVLDGRGGCRVVGGAG